MTLHEGLIALVGAVVLACALQYLQTYRACLDYGFSRAFCASVVLR